MTRAEAGWGDGSFGDVGLGAADVFVESGLVLVGTGDAVDAVDS